MALHSGTTSTRRKRGKKERDEKKGCWTDMTIAGVQRLGDNLGGVFGGTGHGAWTFDSARFNRIHLPTAGEKGLRLVDLKTAQWTRSATANRHQTLVAIQSQPTPKPNRGIS